MTAPAPTAAQQARWDSWQATAVARTRRERHRDRAAAAGTLVTGLAITGAAVLAAMTLPMLTVIITGGLIILGALMVGLGASLVDRGHDRIPLFQAATPGQCEPGRCSCGAPLTTRPVTSEAEAAALATMAAAPEPAEELPPLPPPAEDSPVSPAAEETVLERASRMLPPDFDPKVDSMVDGIPPIRDEPETAS